MEIEALLEENNPEIKQANKQASNKKTQPNQNRKWNQNQRIFPLKKPKHKNPHLNNKASPKNKFYLDCTKYYRRGME